MKLALVGDKDNWGLKDIGHELQIGPSFGASLGWSILAVWCRDNGYIEQAVNCEINSLMCWDYLCGKFAWHGSY